jgi:hypothetical protein
VSHTLGDAWNDLVALNVDEMSFLLWPLLSTPDGDTPGTAARHASRLASEVDTTEAGASGLVDVIGSAPVAQLVLLAVVVAMWVAEGTPGLGE